MLRLFRWFFNYIRNVQCTTYFDWSHYPTSRGRGNYRTACIRMDEHKGKHRDILETKW